VGPDCPAGSGVPQPVPPVRHEVGLLVSAPVILAAIARVPIGLATDRFGGRVVFLLLMLAASLPLVLAGFAMSYVSLLGVSFLLGLAGASFAVGVPFVARWFPPHRQGFALGVYGMGNVGTALAALVAPRVAASRGWPVAFWLWLPLVVATAAIFWLVTRDAPGFEPKSAPAGQSFAIVRREPVIWVLALFYFVTFGGFVLTATLCRPLGGHDDQHPGLSRDRVHARAR
jgi:NNP family nitrate/nitrite transporter-like MFS transporter